MSITREFLGWERPILHTAVQFIVDRCSTGTNLDLQSVALVVPGKRAGRRLLELLAASAADSGRILIPPQIVTAGQLAETLIATDASIVPALVSELAWIKALSESAPVHLSELFAYRPGDQDLSGWQKLATNVASTLTEVAGAGVDCISIAARFPIKSGLDDTERWVRLESLRREYLALISAYGQDKYEAQRQAIRDGAYCTDRDILLIAAYDLPKLTCHVLRQTSAKVISLIHAPVELSESFDDIGSLNTEYWCQADIPIPSGTLHIVGTVQDQARAVVDEIELVPTETGLDQIVVGLGNPDMTGVIERTLQLSGIPARPAVGRSLDSLSPCTLLTSLADVLEDDRTANFAALLRHQDMLEFLRQGTSIGNLADQVPALLDDYIAEHLPLRVSEDMLPERTPATPLLSAVRALNLLLVDLRGPSQFLGDWSGAIVELLSKIYIGRRFNTFLRNDGCIVECLQTLVETLDALREYACEGPLSIETSSAEAIRFSVRHISDRLAANEDDQSSIELLGWLELFCDDAPELILTGLNEGFVPTSVSSDPLLPDSLRAELGITDNQHRYARDAYALRAMVSSKEKLRILCGRLDTEGDPLKPSRLLFADNGDAVVQRALAFYGPTSDSPVGRVLLRHGQHDFLADLPLPERTSEPMSKVTVTAFKDYLACPYRFYLKHILKLATIDGDLPEMDARHVGTLTHRILADFAMSDVKASEDPQMVDTYLQSRLDAHVASLFGSDILPMVQIQLKQLRRRLASFSHFQTEHYKQGWEIIGREKLAVTTIDVSGGQIEVEGRLDRIDRHRDSGQYLILDYKISDSRPDPEKRHRKSKKEWLDLQLPLYRRMAPSVGVLGSIQVGYIGRGQRENDILLSIADWNDSDYNSANDCADTVAQAIHNQVFWPPSVELPRYVDGFEAVCRDRSPDRSRTIEELSKSLRNTGGSL